MEILITIMAFLNGASLAACFFIASRARREVPPHEVDKRAQSIAAQWDNFLRYDGTTNGQKEVNHED